MPNIKMLISLSLTLLWFTLMLGIGLWFINDIWAVYAVSGLIIFNALGSMVLFFIDIFDKTKQ